MDLNGMRFCDRMSGWGGCADFRCLMDWRSRAMSCNKRYPPVSNAGSNRYAIEYFPF